MNSRCGRPGPARARAGGGGAPVPLSAPPSPASALPLPGPPVRTDWSLTSLGPVTLCPSWPGGLNLKQLSPSTDLFWPIPGTLELEESTGSPLLNKEP